MAGYSQTPLIKKLGIKEDMKIMLINAPEDYFDLLELDISEQLVNNESEADLVHIFALSKKEFDTAFRKIISHAEMGLIVWVSWHKKSSRVPTEITEDVIREIVFTERLGRHKGMCRF
jgi:hypothetical protein